MLGVDTRTYARMSTPGSSRPMTPVVRYPAGQITPHGAYHILKGDIPTVKLRADDANFLRAGGLNLLPGPQGLLL
jgi:hypothetical protein